MIHLLDSRLHDAVLDTFDATFGKRPADKQIQIQTTRAEFEGDRTVVVFPLAGMAGGPPHVVAEKLGEALIAAHPWIVAYGVVKGFLNLTLSNESWSNTLKDALTDSWGFAPKGSKSQVMVEYSSPNTNKPLHLGHLRTTSWVTASLASSKLRARRGEGPNHQRPRHPHLQVHGGLAEDGQR